MVGLNKNALKWGGRVIGGVVLATIAKNILFKGPTANNALDAADTVPAAAQALRIAQAFNPSGNYYLMYLDGTSLDDLYQVAREIRDFESVKSYYKKQQRGRNLMSDLKDELNGSELQKFLTLVSSPSGRTATLSPFKHKVGATIYAKGTGVPLYKEPSTQSAKLFTMIEHNGKLGTVQKVVQNSTGKWYEVVINNKSAFINESNTL